MAPLLLAPAAAAVGLLRTAPPSQHQRRGSAEWHRSLPPARVTARAAAQRRVASRPCASPAAARPGAQGAAESRAADGHGRARAGPRASRWVAPRAAAAAAAMPSLVAPTDVWGVWTALLACASFGLWSERTQWGKALSGPLVATLAGLLLSNVGVLPISSPQYGVVTGYLLPLAVPLLLFSADLRRVVRDTGRLLGAFTLGAAGTVLGTLVGLWLLPMHGLGEDAWKMAAAFCSRHIGGAVNYVAVAGYLQITPSVVAAGLAADNLICAIYFASIFALAGQPEPTPAGGSAAAAASQQPAAAAGGEMEDARGAIAVRPAAAALAASAAICAGAAAMAARLGIVGGDIPLATAAVVLLATAFPRQVGALAPAGEGLAAILLQVFFAVVGAAGNVRVMLSTAPALFFFSAVQVAVHLAFVLATGRAAGFTRPEILLASNANVGGPTTAAGMATAKGWRSLLVPAILMGILGYATATFASIALGQAVLAPAWRSGLPA